MTVVVAPLPGSSGRNLAAIAPTTTNSASWNAIHPTGLHKKARMRSMARCYARAEAQRTHRTDHGRASRRSSGISAPHRSHMP